MLYVDPIQAGNVAQAERGVPTGVREKKALEEFERMFLFQMLKEMRKGISEPGLFGRESERKIFHEMLDDAMAGHMAKSGQLGVSDIIAGQLRIGESQSKIQQNIAELRANPAPQGLPLQPPAAPPLSLRAAPAKALPYTRPGQIPLEIPRKGQGFPLTPDARSSNAAKLPINPTSVPEPTEAGRPGNTQ